MYTFESKFDLKCCQVFVFLVCFLRNLVIFILEDPGQKCWIHYTIFASIFPWFYRLNKLTLVEESKSQSADYKLTDSTEIPRLVYDGH